MKTDQPSRHRLLYHTFFLMYHLLSLQPLWSPETHLHGAFVSGSLFRVPQTQQLPRIPSSFVTTNSSKMTGGVHGGLVRLWKSDPVAGNTQQCSKQNLHGHTK